MKIKKKIRLLHLILSIPSGILITLMCLTGAVLVFQDELLACCYPERYYTAETTQEAWSLDSLVNQVNRELASDTIHTIQLFKDPRRTIQASLSSGSRSYVYIDPYTAKITGYYNAREGFFHQVMALHRWLMLPHRAIGRLIIGTSTLFFIVLIISGIICWTPRKYKFTAASFRIKWNGRFVRKVLDLHRITGIYICCGLLVLCFTGLMWSFSWYRGGVAALFNIEQVEKRAPEAHANRSKKKLDSGYWQNALNAVRTETNNDQFICIESNGQISVLPTNAINERATDTYRYEKSSKQLHLLVKYGEKRDRAYLMGWAYIIHVGSWGGIFSQVLTFLVALMGAMLPITGYLLYFRKGKRK